MGTNKSSSSPQPDRPDEYLQPYEQAVREHGGGFRATLWGSRETQVLRFDIMIKAVDFNNTTIIDIGCGPGDFAAHLLEHDIAYERFIGLDALPAMIDTANARKLDRAEFHAADIVTELAMNANRLAEYNADYICFSGTLNTMDDATARMLVEASFEAAAQGVLFNFLSDRPAPQWHEKDLTPARRFNTVAWLGWALSKTPRVLFRQDYLDGHDATIVMWH